MTICASGSKDIETFSFTVFMCAVLEKTNVKTECEQQDRLVFYLLGMWAYLIALVLCKRADGLVRFGGFVACVCCLCCCCCCSGEWRPSGIGRGFCEWSRGASFSTADSSTESLRAIAPRQTRSEPGPIAEWSEARWPGDEQTWV